MRDLTSGMQTAVQDNVLRPFYVIRLDFENDPLYIWTGTNNYAPSGTGDAALNGNVYTPGNLLEVGDVSEDQAFGDPLRITLTGHDLDEPGLRQVVRDKRAWRGRKAYRWGGLLSSDGVTPINHPARVKAAKMVNVMTKRSGDEHIVRIEIDEDMGAVTSAPWRILDHTRVHPNDAYATFMTKLANKPKGFERSDIRKTFPPIPDNPALRASYAAKYWDFFR